MPKIDPKLYEFATVRQLELLEAIDKHGSYRRAAAAPGITKGTLDTAIARVRGKAMTYHDVHGEAARNTVTPEMLEHHEV